MDSKDDKLRSMIFQSIKDLEVSQSGRLLGLICDSIFRYRNDMTCLAENNPHWEIKYVTKIYNLY